MHDGCGSIPSCDHTGSAERETGKLPFSHLAPTDSIIKAFFGLFWVHFHTITRIQVKLDTLAYNTIQLESSRKII